MAIRTIITHQIHGYLTEVNENGQFYKDDGSRVDWRNLRSCASCRLAIREDAHDPCIANLAGTRQACCGHGLAPLGEATADDSDMGENGLGPFLGRVKLDDGREVDVFRRSNSKPVQWGYVELVDGRRLEFAGTCGGQRIRQAVDAALQNEPLPEGFQYASNAAAVK